MSEQMNEKNSGCLFRVGRCVRVRRRHWRAMRRILASVISVMLCFGLEMQQTRADYWLLHGMPTREYVSLYPSWVALTGEFLTNELRAWVDRLGRALPKGSHDVALSLEPGEAAGGPWPWQALDPVGPFSGVNLANGNLYTAIPIVSWDGVSFSLFHNSMADPELPTGLSPGWSHSYSAQLKITMDGEAEVVALYTADDGAGVEFDLTADPCEDNVWCDDVHRLRIKRVQVDDQTVGWRIIDNAQNSMFFFIFECDAETCHGRLESLSDPDGNETKLGYATYDEEARLVSITDPVGRSLILAYNEMNKLKSVTPPPLPSNNDTVVDRVFEFDYTAGGLLEEINSPRRETLGDATTAALFHITLGYASDGLKLKLITDYEANGTSIYYNASNNRVERIDHPLVYDYVRGEDVVTSREYSYSGGGGNPLLTEVTDERGGVSRYLFDASGRLTRVQDQLGRTVSKLTWTESNRPKTTTNVLGGITTVEYDANKNPELTTTWRGTVDTDYDDLNRLTKITDPVGNVTEYLYDQDNDPLMFPRTILGPVGNPAHAVAMTSANYNRIEIEYGAPGTAHHGKPTRWAGPNGTDVRQDYADGNPARTINSDKDDDDCSRVESSTLAGETGESRVTGTRLRCDLVPVSRRSLGGRSGRSAQGPLRQRGEDPQCPEDEPPEENDCPICGCEREYNESGSVISLGEDYTDCESDSTYARAAMSEQGPCDFPEQPQPCVGGDIIYDGNERLVCLYDNRETLADWKVKYTFSYDALVRPKETKVAAYEGLHCQQPFGHNRVYPSYRYTQEYADTVGEFRTTYYREVQTYEVAPGAPVPDYISREIKTVSKTDAAGRIISVERDGAVTKYTYKDSTVAPAVRETRPDGSYTDIYLDPDGAVRAIEHRRANGEVLATFQYTRDAKGRITSVQENIKDDSANGGYRNERSVYAYGDGNLQADDIDPPSGSSPDYEKLYYSFLQDLGGQQALLDGDPNRLISERRTVTDPEDAQVAVQYVKEYWYDQGGNRLVMRVSDPETEDVVSVTRYNYFYEGLYGGDAVGRLSPGTPRPAGTPVMDYEGRGFNKLLSSQTYYPGAPDRIDVVVYEYGKLWKEQVWGDTAGDMTSKVETTWRRTDDGKWNRKYEKVTDYGYERGQLHRIDSTWTDVCPEYCNGVCDEDCEAFILAERAEYHLYDVFGRRIAHNVCHDPSLENSEGELFEWCKSELVHFDYAGLSNQVIAERRDPYIFMDDGPHRALVGDRYVSTYTYGPLGLIMRTAEMSDADPTNNRNHYYLSDVMGGNIGLYMDDDGDPDTDRQAVFQQFDAFGNDMSKPLSSTSSFAWRGREGSVTDRASGLIYMQARHYDPSIGRFIQADALALASLTTQGMNRYIYVENDPVNFTDPLGLVSPALAILIGLGAAFLFGAGFYFGYTWAGGPTTGSLGLLGALMNAGLSFWCGLEVYAVLEMLVLGALSLGSLGIVGAILGGVFILGFILGAVTGALLADTAFERADGIDGPDDEQVIGNRARFAFADIGQHCESVFGRRLDAPRNSPNCACALTHRVATV